MVKAAFKIKSYFQRNAAITRVQKISAQKKAQIQEVLSSNDREGLALKEFVMQLKAKKITPEAFFRICDIQYSKTVSVDRFKDCMKELGITLSNTQLQRLVLILDENFEGNITLEDYQNALQAYQLAGERHFLTNQGSKQSYHPFQNQVLELLVDLMREKDITAEELFNLCDSDDSGFISPNELKGTIEQVKPSLLLKELKGIETYFAKFDLNSDGKLSRQEFNLQLERVERIVERKKEVDIATANEFDNDELVSGDQSFLTDAVDTVKGFFGKKPTASSKTDSADEQKLNIIIKQLELDGMSAKIFVQICKDFQASGDKMQNSQFLLCFQNAYPKIGVELINLIMSKTKLTESEISLSLLDQIVKKFSTNNTNDAKKLLSFVANFMYNLEKRVSDKSDPTIVLEESFQRYLNQLKIAGSEMTKVAYVKLNQAICRMRQQYSEFIFTTLFNRSSNGNSVFLTEVKSQTFQAVSNFKEFSATNTDYITQSSLDQTIPGFSKLSPRSQANSAITQLIKLIKTQKIQPIQVFNMASDAGSQTALNVKLKESFKKLFKTIDPVLIDAACTSFGLDGAMVQKATFVNTFDEILDKTLNSSVPNSKNLQGKKRPATASAVLPIKGEEANMLVRKLDNAMLKQGLSPLVAFKKADVDGNGVILVNELKNVIQFLLPGDAITPADFKMVMMAFDVNRNGRIEQEEFINAFVKARESILATIGPKNTTTQMSIDELNKKYSAPDPAQTNKEKTPHQLLLKVILHRAGKGTKYQLPYWEQEEGLPELVQFQTEVCQTQKILTEQEAKQVYKVLRQDSQSAYQTSLDLLYNKLINGHDSKQSPDGFKLVQTLTIHNDGMVNIFDAAKVFAKIHYNDRQLINCINELEKEIGVSAEEFLTQRELMTAIPILIKSFLVQVSSIPDDEEPTRVNYLAFATGIWMEKAESLYLHTQYDQYWKNIVYHYFGILYRQLNNFGGTPDAIHNKLKQDKNFEFNLKMLKTLGLTKWIRLLDQYTDLSLARNVKCLQVKESRIHLPPLMEKEENLDAFLKNLAASISGQQISTKPASNTTSSQDIKRDEIVFAIEKELQDDISKVLLQYVTQQFIPLAQLLRSFQATNNKVSRNLIERLCQEASNGAYKQDGIKIGDLVRFVCQTSSKFNYQEYLKVLAAQIKAPVKETLLQLLQGNDQDGMITNDEFLRTFQKLEGPQLNKWNLVCLFYRLDMEDGFDETIKFETLVKVISLAKGLPYKEPATTQKPLDKKLTQVENKENASQQKLPEKKQPAAEQKQMKEFEKEKLEKPTQSMPETQQKILATKSKVPQATIDFTKKLYDMNVTEMQVKKELDIEPNEAKLEAIDENVIKYCHALVLLQKKIVNEAVLLKSLQKVSNFIEKQPGNNEESFANLLGPEIERLQEMNPQITEQNILVMRMALLKMEENGKCILDLFELMTITALLVDREDFNTLSVDDMYYKEFIKMPDFAGDSHKHDVDEFTSEAWLKLRAALVTAQKIIAQAQKQKEANGELINIIDDKVWAKVRFSNIAAQLKPKLESNASLKKEFITAFQSSHDKILTFYEFHELLNKVIGSNTIEDWEFEDFFCYIDDCNLAVIEFYDVIEWLQMYEIQLGVIMTTDTVEEDFNRNRNISPADYVITEKDYMRKDCKTILNSEVAALKVAEEIYQVCHVENKKFFDMEFGPTIEDAESDQYFEESAKSLYFNGQTPRGYTNPRQIIWKYPIDYLREGAEDESGKKLSVSIKPKFVIDDASSNEVKQGAIGDCWFIGAMSVVATKDELIRGGGGFINIDVNTKVDADTSQMLSKGVYPPIFHKFRKQGIYVNRIFKNFKWRYVIIDERIPVHLASKLPVFASCVKQEELWVPLIEKAYAKLFGCYETLVSGFIDDGVVDMTGFVCEKKTLSDKDGMFTEDPDKFWEFMHESKENGSLMGCSVAGGGVESKVIIDGVNCGVLSGHAYALNDIIELKGKEGKRNIHRLLRIRNPWGRGEWNGKWSDESEEIQNNMAKIEAYRNELELEEQFEIGAEDGTFLINYKEWRNIYNRLFVANDFECEWNAIRFESEWKMETSGGCPLQGTPQQMINFAKNPQFLVKPKKDCQLFISLGQEDGRVKQSDGTYDKFPFTKVMVNAILYVFELPPGQNKITTYAMDPKYRKKMEKPIVLSEISSRIDLEAGKSYIVLPAVKKEGETHKFFLSLYFNIPLHLMDIRNLTDPKNRYSWIEEENEKSQKLVPQWKKDLIKNETLKYMICKNDITIFHDHPEDYQHPLKKRVTFTKSTK